MFTAPSDSEPSSPGVLAAVLQKPAVAGQLNKYSSQFILCLNLHFFERTLRGS